MFEKKDLQKVCVLGAAIWIAGGVIGMVLSFIYLASASMADITAGTSGFVAGSVLMGSGLISCSLIAVFHQDARASPSADRLA